MILNPGPHFLEPCLGKPDFRVVTLTAQFDPSIEDKPAQHHFPCPDWKAVGQPPVGQAEVLQDRSLAHIGAWICGSHFLASVPIRPSARNRMLKIFTEHFHGALP